VTACPLFIELCAGTAAVSLRLARARARPPVSRMGSKAGWGDTLLGLAGLRPGQGAGHYLWCEPDPGCRLLLEAYRDAALARAAADIIRGWAAEDPRALWERLRAEGPPRLPEGPVDAGEVARWQVLGAWSFRRGQVESGYAPRAEPRVGSGGYLRDGTDASLSHLSSAMGEVGTLPATIHPDARTIDPPALPPGTVVFIDPPYVGTTPYAHTLPRADVVALARRWAAAGALVMVCEAEPIPELVADGWHARDIAHARKGQQRTFSRQQREVVTMSAAPARVPAEQVGLFCSGDGR
jgi:hypothetical protein